MNAGARNFVMLVLMLTASGMALALRPAAMTDASGSSPTIETQVPMMIGNWVAVPSSSMAIVDPQQQETLDRIYTQVVNRTYRHSTTGQVVMLSIAFGSDQTKRDQVHRPEICYPAQGFQIVSSAHAELKAGGGDLRATRMVARAGSRNEPITYWIRIGNHVVRGAVEQKLAIVKEGLAGHIPSGVLVRVSSIGSDTATEYAAQAEFIKDFLDAVPPSARKEFVGVLGS